MKTMKNLKMLLAGLLLFAGLNVAEAQQNTNVGQALRGLINVNVGAVAVNVGDITLEDLVNVEDVLNDLHIDVLNNAINQNEIASRNQDFLNNLLREADLITDNQVVVGVLSGGQYIIQDL
jgi:hypothetical protein